jgi:hypothetical protein
VRAGVNALPEPNHPKKAFYISSKSGIKEAALGIGVRVIFIVFAAAGREQMGRSTARADRYESSRSET